MSSWLKLIPAVAALASAITLLLSNAAPPLYA
jgi:hypothetical protein